MVHADNLCSRIARDTQIRSCKNSPIGSSSILCNVLVFVFLQGVPAKTSRTTPIKKPKLYTCMHGQKPCSYPFLPMHAVIARKVVLARCYQTKDVTVPAFHLHHRQALSRLHCSTMGNVHSTAPFSAQINQINAEVRLEPSMLASLTACSFHAPSTIPPVWLSSHTILAAQTSHSQRRRH